MKKIFLLLNIVFIMGLNMHLYSANVQEKSGTTAFPFLKITQGARAAAMGDSFTGLSDDANSIYWNPAGMVQLTSQEIVANHTIWFESISKYYLGYVKPSFLNGAAGVGINYVSVGGIEERTDEKDHEYKSISVYSVALTFTYSRKLNDKIFLGGGLKLTGEHLYKERGNFNVLLDLGGMYKLDNKISLGASIQNIGTPTTKGDPMPILLRLGAMKRFIEDKLLVLCEGNVGIIDLTSSLSFGAEYKVSKIFYPRAGYKIRFTNTNYDFLSGLSAGFGIKYRSYNFDYAIAPYGDLGLTHRIDFGVKF